ncbi:MAG TPA: hypothetical protein VGP72_32310 [Planctomycetota bacterium]|jgi:hypothetical protein
MPPREITAFAAEARAYLIKTLARLIDQKMGKNPREKKSEKNMKEAAKPNPKE